MIHTQVCDRIGIEYPIFQGGMAWVSEYRLAAAVSNAGGLGLISAMNADGEYLREQIRACRELTDKPFGVNVMLMSPHAAQVAKVILEEKVPVVTTGAGLPGVYMKEWVPAGIKVVPVVPSVAIARRVYRTGESEYTINRAACRLKDVIDLFRDTGVGRDGYSLVGQGRVDEILSSKSEDRRQIFEEAAGIVKYRARRNEAERRMENTRMNLSRVEDILGEMNARIEPLREQSETAREYLKLRDELKGLDLNVFLVKTERLNARIEELRAQAQELSTLSTQAAQAQADLARERGDVEQALSELEQRAAAEREERRAARRAAREAELAAHADERAAAEAERARTRAEKQAYADKQAKKRAILKALREQQ